jgi:CCR4-NOT transcriptional regulation complex NOT5 subunit
MERFKACEKEIKTKAFSKEGLNAATKVDPREQEKEELCSWVTDTVEALNLQVEKFEAEQETLQLGLRKSKKDSSKQEKMNQIAHQIERHKFHMTKLEIILRMLENDNISFDEVCTNTRVIPSQYHREELILIFVSKKKRNENKNLCQSFQLPLGLTKQSWRRQK